MVWCGETYIEVPRALWIHGEHERPDGHYTAPTVRRWGETWRIWTIFGVRPSTRKDEDVFELLDRAPKNFSAQWFLSCGQNDPLHAVNQRFVQRMRERGMNLDLINTPVSHDWQSWNAAMPVMFKTEEKSLR